MSAQEKTEAGKPRKMGAEKKKAAALLGLVAVGLLLWGRLLIQQVPRTVVANPSASASAETPGNPAGEIPADQGSGALAMAPLRSQARPVVTVDLPTNLCRDVFTFDASRYTRVVKDEIAPRPVEKSVVKTTDEKVRVTPGAPQANGLVLQTTIQGEHPRAMINGQVLTPGQKINGFVLRKVLPRQVILEMNGVEIRLEM